MLPALPTLEANVGNDGAAANTADETWNSGAECGAGPDWESGVVNAGRPGRDSRMAARGAQAKRDSAEGTGGGNAGKGGGCWSAAALAAAAKPDACEPALALSGMLE